MGTGFLSYEEFKLQVKRFVDISNKINDHWQLLEARSGVVYMKKRCTKTADNIDSQMYKTASLSSQLDHLTDPHKHMFCAKYDQNVLDKQHSSIQIDQEPHQVQRDMYLTPTMSPSSTGHPEASQDNHSPKDDPKISKCSPNVENYNYVSKLVIDDGGGTVGNEEHLEEMESADEDGACVSEPRPLLSCVTYEYHVIYSESYSVPVLYLNVFTSDGKLLPLDQVWERCPSSFTSYMKVHKWATLTQQEHPLLGRPFLQLHPCHTAELMSQVTKNSHTPQDKKHYLATWLSTVGPLVDLKISPNYVLL